MRISFCRKASYSQHVGSVMADVIGVSLGSRSKNLLDRGSCRRYCGPFKLLSLFSSHLPFLNKSVVVKKIIVID